MLTAETGPIVVGRDCVIMENAVLRGTRRHPLTVGDAVLVGPRAEVRINGTVHIRTRLEADATVPIGWVAAGDPAVILPPERHDDIWAVQKPLDFPKTVFGVDRPPPGTSIMPDVMPRYAAALGRHKDDEIL